MKGRALFIVLVLALFVIVPSASAYSRPAAVTSVEVGGSCGWQEGYKVAFDTGEVVMVGYAAFDQNDKPFVGTVASFWRAYWSLDFPFWHAAGFTQVRSDGSHTGRISFTECS